MTTVLNLPKYLSCIGIPNDFVSDAGKVEFIRERMCKEAPPPNARFPIGMAVDLVISLSYIVMNKKSHFGNYCRALARPFPIVATGMLTILVSAKAS